MATVEQAAAGLEYGSILEFVQIDFTSLGGSLFNVFNSIDLSDAGGELTFLGQTWQPIPFISEGWAIDGSGGQARPVITIADANALLLTSMFAFDDAIGAPVYRYKTTVEGASEGSYYGPETWLVNRIVQADGMILKFELAAPYDQIVRKVPNRQMFREEFPGLQRQ